MERGTVPWNGMSCAYNGNDCMCGSSCNGYCHNRAMHIDAPENMTSVHLALLFRMFTDGQLSGSPDIATIPCNFRICQYCTPAGQPCAWTDVPPFAIRLFSCPLAEVPPPDIRTAHLTRQGFRKITRICPLHEIKGQCIC